MFCTGKIPRGKILRVVHPVYRLCKVLIIIVLILNIPYVFTETRLEIKKMHHTLAPTQFRLSTNINILFIFFDLFIQVH